MKSEQLVLKLRKSFKFELKKLFVFSGQTVSILQKYLFVNVFVNVNIGYVYHYIVHDVDSSKIIVQDVHCSS